jgi:uncharacterized repeat protein (TIGR03806 family)
MKLKLALIAGLVFFITAQSFITYTPPANGGNAWLLPKLSDYHLYSGLLSDLVPEQGFVPYEIATPLFSDYSEKERLIKIPAGQALTATGDNLPQFPNGTILVKTFFYLNDNRDPSKGRRIVETRILLRTNNTWQAGTYVWNAAQTEAILTTSGSKMDIHWVDETGIEQNIAYQVPSIKQCSNCHNSDKELQPIGFKIRNLNINVARNNTLINQLKYFSDLSILTPIDPASFSTLPAWNNSAYTIEQRARAYLEVNCAHCHQQNGYCSQSGFRPGYENPLEDTHIIKKREKILKQLKSGRMPLSGTNILHKEGIELIEAYLISLK